MGDAADSLTDDGMDELATHEAGECEYGCPYCEEEGDAEWTRSRRESV